MSAANQDRVRELSYPKQSSTKLSSAQATKIKAMSANYTQAEIAELLGLSTSTVSKYIHGKA